MYVLYTKLCVYYVFKMMNIVVDKTRDSTNSKIWPNSTCAISVRRKGQILLVVESLVLSTTCLVNKVLTIIVFLIGSQ